MSGQRARRRIARILKRLEAAYGRPPRRRHGKAVDVLVGTILSQNTSGTNSSAGFRQLKRRFRSWPRAADAPVRQIEACIRVSGLSRIKAPRIRRILRQIRRERGRIDLEFLARWEPSEASRYLTRFEGVGPKTALCVLMFSFGMDVFPVDTHICRLARRLGLMGAKATAEKAHQLLAAMIEPGDRYAMHVLLIAHGRRVCRARKPQCGRCSSCAPMGGMRPRWVDGCRVHPSGTACRSARWSRIHRTFFSIIWRKARPSILPKLPVAAMGRTASAIIASHIR